MALTTAFCANGNKTPIPPTTTDGSVSYDQGFGAFYALPPEEGGLFIDREQFNQLMYDTTSQILENKTAISNLNSATYSKTEVNNLLNAKANANATVNLTGAQTVQGVKTFAVPPVSATNPTANNQVANKAYVDSKISRYITETYSKGTSWYRIWSDKWCEQGGGGSAGTITFLKPFKDANYTVTTRMLSGSGDIAWHEYGENTNKTTITFTVGTRPVSWHACGYIA